MSDRFPSNTGVPMVDLFFKGFTMALDVQRKVYGGMLSAPLNTKVNRLQQRGREIALGATEQQSIPVTKEELRVGKREVRSAKAYRVSATTVEVPVEQQVNLRAETVVIERRPTSGTTVRNGESFKDHTIEIYEMHEEPVIGKVLTQAEEVVIYKTLSERTATIRDTVRETRVKIEERAPKARSEDEAESGTKLLALTADKPALANGEGQENHRNGGTTTLKNESAKSPKGK